MDISAFSSLYFKKSSNILRKYAFKDVSLAQFYSLTDKNSYVFGIEYIITIIKNYCIKNNYHGIVIKYIPDGSMIKKFYPVISIKGNYWKVIKLENIICGILSQGSTIFTNAKNVLSLTKKEIVFMADRNDIYLNQLFNGYAAYHAGLRYFTTEKEVELFKDKDDYNIVGTMPHSIIEIAGGDLCKAISWYIKVYSQDRVIALVDYNNDVITDSIAVCKKFKKQIYAIRIDTSPKICDKSLSNSFENKGVCVNLLKLIRKKLNMHGFDYVKIIASSSINPNKIQNFIDNKCEPDYYGIGEYFINNEPLNFSCDLVELNNKKSAKFGRKKQEI